MNREIYPEYSRVWDFKELPHAKMLSELLENTTGYTYPSNILARRVNLLSKEEKEKCDKLWNKICKDFDKIETIISNRAEIEKDPWEVI